MLKINKIKFDVNTTSGLYGSKYEFSNGLNIIRADNTSGKSSLFQAITYCLGFEEIIGGKNEKTMQSVFRDQVEYPKGVYHQVIQSFVYLEIENEVKEIITIRRSVVSSDRKPQLVDVYFGKVIDETHITVHSQPMFVHDKGGASDDIYGFHYYLETFLNWTMPNVMSTSGDSRKLYLQQVASSFLVEQKSGWSDFFATMPYYSLTNKEARTIEFLLDLDVSENKKLKQHISYHKRLLEDRWELLNKEMLRHAEKGGGELVGLELKPVILNDTNKLGILITRDDIEYPIDELLDKQIEELSSLEEKSIFSVGQNLGENEQLLEKLNNQINRLSINYETVNTELNFDREKLRSYKNQLDFLKKDLRNNKGALKMKSLGSDYELKTAEETCPTCQQGIHDSLLPLDVEQVPMRLEDNIDFIDAQVQMIRVYVEGQEKVITEKERKNEALKMKLAETRSEVRQIKRELISDDRLPSIREIEHRLNLKKKIEFYNRFLEDFNKMIEDQNALSASWSKILTDEKNLPKNYFSKEDFQKLEFLENRFKSMLKTFNYNSQQSQFIHISHENYLPIIRKPFGEETLNYHIRFDSSGSDFIRCIWAYTFSLLETSIKFDCHHPRLIMMDEPKQQDAAIEDFHIFLKTISSYTESQILIFASFENSDEAFKIATENIEFNLIHLTDKLIRPMEIN